MIHWWLNIRNHEAFAYATSLPIIVVLNQVAPSAQLISSSNTNDSLNDKETSQVNGNIVFTATADRTFGLDNTSAISKQSIFCSISIIKNAR